MFKGFRSKVFFFRDRISLSSSNIISKLPECIHALLDIRTDKSMNQFFYNMAETYWALKHVLFVFNYKVLTMHGEGEQRIIKRRRHRSLTVWKDNFFSQADGVLLCMVFPSLEKINKTKNYELQLCTFFSTNNKNRNKKEKKKNL